MAGRTTTGSRRRRRRSRSRSRSRSLRRRDRYEILNTGEGYHAIIFPKAIVFSSLAALLRAMPGCAAAPMCFHAPSAPAAAAAGLAAPSAAAVAEPGGEGEKKKKKKPARW